MPSSFHTVTITLKVEVTDPTQLRAAMAFTAEAPDGSGPVLYVPADVELAVVDRLAAVLNKLFEPALGMRVVEHCEAVDSWTSRGTRPSTGDSVSIPLPRDPPATEGEPPG